MPRIAIPDDFPAVMLPSQAYCRWNALGPVSAHDTLPASEDELVERIREAEAVIVIRASTRFTEGVLLRCPRLRLVSLWGTGTDNVDLAAATRLGITVTNTPAVAADSIAEHCLALMLAIARSIPATDAATRAGRWPRAQATQMRGKTLGVIGLGAIGSRFARLGAAIGMKVLTWTMHPHPGLGFEPVTLERLFAESDVVSVHLRLSPDTERMVGAAEFSRMKPGAIFLNTARGAIVDESALLDALQHGPLGGAGLDVFDQEPLPAAHPLTKLDNVVLTPHAAGITAEALEAGLRMALDNVTNYFAGSPSHIVAAG